MEYPEHVMIFEKEPLVKYTPSYVRQWLDENYCEYNLATIFARVCDRTGWLIHEIDEMKESDKLKARFDEWMALSNDLVDKVLMILQEENNTGKAEHDLTILGWHSKVKPFMERNGFIDCSGWWVEKERIEKRGENI